MIATNMVLVVLEIHAGVLKAIPRQIAARGCAPAVPHGERRQRIQMSLIGKWSAQTPGFAIESAENVLVSLVTLEPLVKGVSVLINAMAEESA